MSFDPVKTALLTIDLQNDFLHPEGAYGRAGQSAEAIAALPGRIRPVRDALRAAGGTYISAQFTLVPGPAGEPLIAPHLKVLRPFLGKGDFAPGSFGQDLIDRLAPSDIRVEKVAFSAFYQSRMEWTLQKFGIDTLVFAGIVTNGGVASTVRDAHLRDFYTVVLEDGCAAFSAEAHDSTIGSLSTISEIAACAEASGWWT